METESRRPATHEPRRPACYLPQIIPRAPVADLICDTNVFYNIASGVVDPGTLRGAGHRLLLTPVSVLELVSHVTPQNFGTRRQAAAAALNHHDEILEDPESLLAECWGVATEPPGIDWLDGLRALSAAGRFEDLQGGVPDFGAGVIRRLDVPAARAWRGGHYDDFERLVTEAIDEHVPGYGRARARGRMRQATNDQVRAVEAHYARPGAILAVLLATRERAALAAVEPVQAPTAQEVELAVERLLGYALIYTRYFINVASTRYAPQPNDFGDLECFLYLRESRVVATSEARWLEIAREVELGEIAVDPAAAPAAADDPPPAG